MISFPSLFPLSIIFYFVSISKRKEKKLTQFEKGEFTKIFGRGESLYFEHHKKFSRQKYLFTITGCWMYFLSPFQSIQQQGLLG